MTDRIEFPLVATLMTIWEIVASIGAEAVSTEHPKVARPLLEKRSVWPCIDEYSVGFV